MKNNNKAFTLTELLVAIGIVGAIAALSIPSLMNSINKRLLATQMKSITGSIQQTINDQLVSKKTKNLLETDFASAGTLLTDTNFSIAKSCAAAEYDKCWSTATYKVVNPNSNATYARPAYNTIVKLKNGVAISYRTVAGVSTTDPAIGQFFIDVNGDDYPNIVGRDLFSFYITKKGKILPYNKQIQTNNYDYSTSCTGGNPVDCFGSLLENGWVMDY